MKPFSQSRQLFGKTGPGTLPASLLTACPGNPRVRTGRGPVQAKRADAVSFFFANLHPARFLRYSHLRVSPIRVCGLGGVRFALNGRTPFRFNRNGIKGLPWHAREVEGHLGCAWHGNGATGQGARLRLQTSKALNSRHFDCRKQGELTVAPPQRPAWDRTLGKAGEPRDLLHVAGDQLGHLEHADALLAVENGLQALVTIDLGADFLVLQTVLPDITPKLFGQFRPRERGGADHLGQFFIRCHRFHERCAGFTFCFCFCCHASLLTVSRRNATKKFAGFGIFSPPAPRAPAAAGPPGSGRRRQKHSGRGRPPPRRRVSSISKGFPLRAGRTSGDEHRPAARAANFANGQFWAAGKRRTRHCPPRRARTARPITPKRAAAHFALCSLGWEGRLEE